MSPDLHFQFHISSPDGGVETREVRSKDTIWLGRNADCDVVLSSLGVSRRHTSCAWHDDHLLVTDCSRNGTRVDGVLLQHTSRQLANVACSIGIGPYELRLTVDSVAPTKAPGACMPTPKSAPPAVRRRIHRALLDHLELPKLDRTKVDDREMRERVIAALRRIVTSLAHELADDVDEERLIAELADEALGLGPLEPLLDDPEISEIMVVDPHNIYVERDGKLERTSLRFTDNDSIRAVIERIITPLGRRIDESSPLVDARLKDGSRVNAVIPPLALKGACLTIRKFNKRNLTMVDLVQSGSLDQRMATFLEHAVQARRNIVVSGGTGSGKTTLLNVLSAAISPRERIITIEDAAELRLAQPHVVSLEARPANIEGKGEMSIRSLLKNALRMRPDRIIVGECRGSEVLDMLQAMNTGHEGSMTSAHANSPREAISRIETLCLLAGVDFPLAAIRAQIAASIHLVVQQARFNDGSRRVVSIAEVTGIDDGGTVQLSDLFELDQWSTAPNGRATVEFRATGHLPSFLDRLLSDGLIRENEFL